MGFLDDLFDLTEEIVKLPFEIAGGLAELGNDLTETVVTGGSGYTSYDVRRKADKIVDKSRADLSNAKQNLESQWSAVSSEAAKVARQRSEVYSLVKLQIHKGYLLELPSASQLQPETLYAPGLDEDSFNFGTFLGVLGIDERRKAADKYLQKAVQYQAEVARKVIEYKELERLVRNISNHQQEELKMLDVIRRTYRQKGPSVLSETEDGLRKLAELCNQRLSAATDRAYGELLRKLKSLWM